MKAAKFALTVALCAAIPSVAHPAETCQLGGLPGLATVAAKLKVRPSADGMLPDCIGNRYDVGALLLAAVIRIEAAEKAAAEAQRDAAEVRKMFTVAPTGPAPQFAPLATPNSLRSQ